jgi:tetratricopeptide (TPR) repeat protein
MKDLFKKEIAAECQTMQDLPMADAICPPVAEQEAGVAGVIREEPQVVPKAETPKIRQNRTVLYAGIAVVLVAVVVVLSLWFKGRSAKPPVQEAAVKSVQPPVAEPPKEAVPDKTAPAAAKVTDKGPDHLAEAKDLLNQAAGLLEKKPQEAKSLLLKATTLDPGNSQAHFQLGSVYMKLKDYPKAIESYQRVADLDAKFPDAFFNLGYLYAIRKDYLKAEEMYGRVVKLAPSYLDEALFNLGMVQEKQGKRKESVENLERALSINPSNEMAKKLLLKLKGKS